MCLLRTILTGTMLVFCELACATAAPSSSSDAELETLWEALASPSDPVGERDAYRAIQSLVERNSRVVVFLRARVRPVEAGDQAQLSREIAHLESPDFATRREAMDRLRGAGRLVRGLVERKMGSAPSLDLRKRLEELLQGIEGTPLTTEELRALRAIEVLEKMGTPDALAMLKELAQGAPAASATQAARAVLNRQAQRKPGG